MKNRLLSVSNISWLAESAADENWRMVGISEMDNVDTVWETMVR